MYILKSHYNLCFSFFCLLFKTLLSKKQNKVLNVKVRDKPII